MSQSLEMNRYESHTLYNREDFTQAEIDRKNHLAVAVLENHQEVCKRCGRTNLLLRLEYCSSPIR